MIGEAQLGAAPPMSELGEFLRRFRRNRSALIGSVIVALVLVVALLARQLAPYGYADTDLALVWMDPDAGHLLGTDGLGRDILSRILAGASVSLGVAGSVLALTLVFGTFFGMLAGYLGGWFDTVVMRGADIISAFPELVFAIMLAAVLGPSVLTVILALATVWWPGIARLARSLVLALRQEQFIEAAVVSGTRRRGILLRHLLPNILAPLLVRASIGVGFIITAVSTQPPM